MSFCVRCTDPDGNEMHLRNGFTPGEGPIIQYRTKKEAEGAIDFMKMGMTKGEDYDFFEVIRYSKDLPEVDEA